MKPFLIISLVFTFWIAIPETAQAQNGQQCAATSTHRGKFCQAPFAGYAQKAQCVAAYNACLNAMPALMHRWCVQIDQKNCDKNDDCPQGSCCFVHPVNQQRQKDIQCYQFGPNNRWTFEVFDVADCKCDCAKSAYPEPPEGPEGITLACDVGGIDCSGCENPVSGKEGTYCADLPQDERQEKEEL